MADPAPSAAPTSKPAWHALLIGVDRYQPPIPQLRGCVNDSQSLSRFLSSRVSPDAKIRMLVAARGEMPAGAEEATAENIRRALSELIATVRRGDNVLIQLSCHGVRVQNQGGQRFYGFAPTDTGLAGRQLSNLILAHELNAALRALSSAGAAVTVLADTCHSGMSTKQIDAEPLAERRIDLPDLTDEQWRDFNDAHPALRGAEAPPPETRAVNAGEEKSGWVSATGEDEDWICFAACRETQTAKEAQWNDATLPGSPLLSHGAFTASLLEALKDEPAERITALRWMDIKDKVVEAVKGRAVEQNPALEGRPEKTLFGGPWRRFDPGFNVQPGKAAGLVELDGGLMHSLEPGAEVAIYPPDTASFGEAEAAGVKPVRARVESAEPSRSVARVLGGDPPVARSRARIAKPGPSTRPLKVALAGVPEPVASGIAKVSGAADYLALNLAFNPEGGAADVEVRPWKGPIPSWTGGSEADPAWVGTTGGYVIALPGAAGEGDTGAVIAYVPLPDHVQPKKDDADIGYAIGAGLVQWARYRRALESRTTDPGLAAAVQVGLRVAPKGAGKTPAASCIPCKPDASGVYQLTDQDAFWIELNVQPMGRERLFGGVVLFSNDGNVIPVWPPQGGGLAMGSMGSDEAGFLTQGTKEALFIGQDRHNAACLSRRPDQESSLYTFKIIASTSPDGEPPNLGALAIDATVQQLVADLLHKGGFVAPAPQKVVPRWSTWEIPVRVRSA